MPRDRITGKKVAKKCVGVSLLPSTYDTGDIVEPTMYHMLLSDMDKLERGIRGMETVGFTFPTYNKEPDKERAAFKGKASLWRSIKISIAEIFFGQLSRGELFIEDPQGNKYGLKLMLESRDGVFPELPDEDPDDIHR